MKNIILLVISLLMFSCSTSHDVVHNGFLQKRKYKKGYNLSFKKKERKQELLALHEYEEVKSSDKEVKASKVSNEKAVGREELNETSDLVVSADEETGLYITSVIEKTLSLNVKDTLVLEEVKTVHNSEKQKLIMKRAREYRTVGLSLLGVYPLTIVFYFFILAAILLVAVYLLFLLSVHKLIKYAKNRIYKSELILEENLKIETHRLKLIKYLKWHYALLALGLINIIIVLIGVVVPLFVWILLLFQIALIFLIFYYFKLFKLIKEEDKIGKRYNNNSEK